jgi:hypothetical protein
MKVSFAVQTHLSFGAHQRGQTSRNDWVEKRNGNGEVIGWTVNGEHIQRSRARLETRKWLMSKRVPKKYGDKVEQTLQGPEGSPVQQETTYRYIVVRPGDSGDGSGPTIFIPFLPLAPCWWTRTHELSIMIRSSS